MFKNNMILSFVGLVYFMLSNANYAESRYFLCGSDEDGCFMDQIQYCACIPLNENNYQQPYCLTFNGEYSRCDSLTKVPDCLPILMFKDQGRCLAALYQSISEPPCKIASHAFCMENHAWICEESGDLSTCRKA